MLYGPKKKRCIFTNLFCSFGPKDGKQIQSCDWWREICTDSLNVDEKLASLYILHHRDPQDAYSGHDRYHYPAKNTAKHLKIFLTSFSNHAYVYRILCAMKI